MSTTIDPRDTSDDPAWRDRAVLHVDIDAFFAAVEQLDHPEWRGLPVIVGGDPSGRGVVSTASYEARRFGVGSAMPAARAAILCPDAIWAPPRFDRYRELSDAVFAILRSVSPRVQPVSVDEAFLDVTPGRFRHDHPVAIARDIREQVCALGLTVSVGVATNKTIAKIASDHEKPDGLTVVPPGSEAAFLSPLPVETMSGIGPKTAQRLRTLGIRTLGELAALDEMTATSLLGSGGAVLTARAGGDDPRPVRTGDEVKSVSNERTFPVDIRDSDELRTALTLLSAKVASRLRRKGHAGRTVTVKLRFSDFTTRTASRTLSAPIDTEHLIRDTADALLMQLWSAGIGVRLLGVGVTGFEPIPEQLSVFSEVDEESDGDTDAAHRLAQGLDAIRQRFGPDALRFGSALPRTTDPESTEE